MQRDTRVRITGLKNRPELNGREGVVLFYVPTDHAISWDHRRFAVKVDGVDEKFRIKLQNLMACEHEEEESGDCLFVNGLVYCKAHKTEYCPYCCMDHRVTNRMAMIEGGDYGEADSIVEEENCSRGPMLCAPKPSPLSFANLTFTAEGEVKSGCAEPRRSPPVDLDGRSEGLIASQICDRNDPSLLTLREIKKGFGSCTNFCHVYELNPTNPLDLQELKEISKGLRRIDQARENATLNPPF